MMIIKNGVQKIKVIFNILFLSFLLFSSLHAQDIEDLPLINLNELEPTYEDEVIDRNIENDSKDNDFINSKNKNFEESFATISLLNKITAEVKTINIKLKEHYLYEELKIYAIDCYNSKPLEKAETAVYLNIYIEKTMKKIFNGWMIKSLPSISSMEHPIYDLWVDDCYKL